MATPGCQAVCPSKRSRVPDLGLLPQSVLMPERHRGGGVGDPGLLLGQNSCLDRCMPTVPAWHTADRYTYTWQGVCADAISFCQS